MELIPVFSLIVLVATVATFILAIGAYVMFRIRESSGGGRRLAIPESYEADVFAPQPVDPPPQAITAHGNGRRESLKDPRVQLPSETFPAGDAPAADDRRRWQ